MLNICLDNCSTQSQALKLLSNLFNSGEDENCDAGWCYIILRAFIQEAEDEFILVRDVEEYVIRRHSKLVNPALFRYILQNFYDSGKVFTSLFISIFHSIIFP